MNVWKPSRISQEIYFKSWGIQTFAIYVVKEARKDIGTYKLYEL